MAPIKEVWETSRLLSPDVVLLSLVFLIVIVTLLTLCNRCSKHSFELKETQTVQRSNSTLIGVIKLEEVIGARENPGINDITDDERVDPRPGPENRAAEDTWYKPWRVHTGNLDDPSNSSEVSAVGNGNTGTMTTTTTTVSSFFRQDNIAVDGHSMGPQTLDREAEAQNPFVPLALDSPVDSEAPGQHTYSIVGQSTSTPSLAVDEPRYQTITSLMSDLQQEAEPCCVAPPTQLSKDSLKVGVEGGEGGEKILYAKVSKKTKKTNDLTPPPLPPMEEEEEELAPPLPVWMD